MGVLERIGPKLCEVFKVSCCTRYEPIDLAGIGKIKFIDLEKDMTLREKIIANAVTNMHEFGYPHADRHNILTDEVYSAFFIGMLKSNFGHSAEVDAVIKELLKEIGGKE